MAIFTQGQTEQCGILKARKIYYDDTFKEWHFIIRGDNGVKYEFVYSTSENLHYSAPPTQTEVLEFVSDYMRGTSHKTGGGTYTGVERLTTALKINTAKGMAGVNGGTPTKNESQGNDPL